jgi:hypothetical protein
MTADQTPRPRCQAPTDGEWCGRCATWLAAWTPDPPPVTVRKPIRVVVEPANADATPTLAATATAPDEGTDG